MTTNNQTTEEIARYMKETTGNALFSLEIDGQHRLYESHGCITETAISIMLENGFRFVAVTRDTKRRKNYALFYRKVTE